MSTELRLDPGTWTKAGNKQEQHAILEIGRSLGLYDLLHGTVDNDTALFVSYERGPLGTELLPAAFLASLYHESERRKERLAEGDRIYAKGKPEIWQDHEKQLAALGARIEKLEAWNLEQMFTEHADGFVAVDARLGPLVNVISKPLMKRIEALEPAFDEHLRKQHEQEVVLSDMDLLCIIRQRKDALIKTQDYADAKLWRDVERALIIAARIPVDAPESDT